MKVAIVGGGPAGAMAAVRLARAGGDVLLFDPSHPREKICGGGLTGRALHLLADVIDVSALPATTVSLARVESPDDARPAASVTLINHGACPESSLVVLSRAVFDKALVDAACRAGACLIPEKVTSVTIRNAPTRVLIRSDRREYVADFVLGADGANSLVRKTVAAPFSRAQLSVASGYFVHGVTSSAIEIKPALQQPGYLWSFPRPDHLAVGICAPAIHRTPACALQQQSFAWLRDHGLDRGHHLEPYSWPIPSIGVDARNGARLAAGNWMLLGDAAGLVDPLTREGIYYALLSGQAAAEALISCSHDAAARAYAARLQAKVLPELTRAAKLCRLFFSPAFAGLLVEALEDSPDVRRVFVDLVGGTQPYRGLRRRLLATREWRLAGRAIRLALTPRFTGTMKSAILPRHSSTA